MILELNRLLKKEGYDYSVHSIGGCASCGLSLRNEGKESDLEDVRGEDSNLAIGRAAIYLRIRNA